MPIRLVQPHLAALGDQHRLVEIPPRSIKLAPNPMQRRPGQETAGDVMLRPRLSQAVYSLVEMLGGSDEIARTLLLCLGQMG
jgi:hypothetical protein